MLTSSGAFGSQFARGFDPVLGNLGAPVIDFHYTGYEGSSNSYTDPVSGITYAVPDEVFVDGVSGFDFDQQLSVITSLEDLYTYQTQWVRYCVP